jgi:hypothetical protein
MVGRSNTLLALLAAVIFEADGESAADLSRQCRLTFWILKRAAKLLASINHAHGREILLNLNTDGYERRRFRLSAVDPFGARNYAPRIELRPMK